MAILERLLTVFDTGQSLNPETTEENASVIKGCFRDHIDQSQLGENLDQLFDEEDGIRPFMVKFLGDFGEAKLFHSSKEHFLDLFKFLLTNAKSSAVWKRSVGVHCKTMWRILILYWRHKPAKHQQLALDCLILILDTYGEEMKETEYDVSTEFNELITGSEKTSHPPSVRGKIFQCMGLLANRFADLFEDRNYERFDLLCRHVVTTIQTQVKSDYAKVEVSLLQGGLEAMDSLLQKFYQRIRRHNEVWGKFVECLIRTIDPKVSIAPDPSDKQYVLKRRQFQRVSLRLIANHTEVLKEQLFEHYKARYKDFFTWLSSNNSEDNSVGKKVMYKFLETVFKLAEEKREVGGKENEVSEFVDFFLQKFGDILNSPAPKRNETTVALKGIGMLASLCSDRKEFQGLVEQVFIQVKDMSFELNNTTDKYSGSLIIFTTYLEVLASLLMSSISAEPEEAAYVKYLGRLNFIEQLLMQFFTVYPRLNEYQRKNGHFAFLKIIRSLHRKHQEHCLSILDRLLNTVLVQIIASPTKVELDILHDAMAQPNNASEGVAPVPRSDSRLHGVSSYADIWLNSVNNKTPDLIIASKVVYDRILTWIITTMEKLDFSLLPADDDKLSALSQEPIIENAYSNLLPAKPKDFQLMINLVEFTQNFLRQTDRTWFLPWLPDFMSKIIAHSTQHPLVSGFYKLLMTIWQIGNELTFFDADTSLDKEQISEESRRALIEQCHGFLKLIVNRMSSMRDDLLEAVLDLWLSAPDTILLANLDTWSSTLEKIFVMGRVCPELANKAIDAISRWMALEAISREIMESIILKLFPIWLTYFQSATSGASVGMDKLLHVKAKRAGGSKEKKSGPLPSIAETEIDSKLSSKVQTSLLQLIGTFGHLDFPLTSDCHLLESGDNVLKFGLSLGTEAPDIYLDKLVPRALLLCETSTDRKTRTAACEFLHTVVIYFLGYAVKPSTSSGNHSVKLFSKVFKTMLRLSGDGDALVRQLFNPLALQCVHYFTQKRNDYAETIFDAILEGMISNDGQLRDFSAECFAEYFAYATRKDQKDLVSQVIKCITTLNSHASANYRMGACVGFNAIYLVYKEESEISNENSIFLMTAFLTSLGIRRTSKDSALLQATLVSISYLEKILIGRKDNFNNNIGERRKPPDFKSVRLRDLCDWLLRRLASPMPIFRQECERLLRSFLPVLRGPGIPPCAKSYLSQFASNSNQELVLIAEETSKHVDMSSTSGMLTFLDSSAAFYRFFDSYKCLQLEDEDPFSSPDSIFMATLEEVAGNTYSELSNSDLELIARITGALQCLSKPINITDQFQVFLIKLTTVVTEEQEMSEIIELLSSLDVVFEVKQQVNSRLSIVQVAVSDGRLEAMSVCDLVWLRLVSEKGLLQKVATSEKIEELNNLLWNSLNQLIFKDSIAASAMFINKDLKKMEEVLKTCITLGLPHSKILEQCFNTDKCADSFFSSKGELFRRCFGTVLFNYKFTDFEEMSKSFKLNDIGIYVEVLLNATKVQSSTVESKKNLFEKIIDVWPQLSVNCDPFAVGRLLLGLSTSSPKECKSSEPLCKWWCSRDAMCSSEKELIDKSDLISFMSLFGTSENSRVAEKILDCADTILQYHFPSAEAVTKNEDAILKFIEQLLVIFEHNPKDVRIGTLLSDCALKVSMLKQETGGAQAMLSVISRRLKKLAHRLGDKVVEEICSLIWPRIVKTEDADDKLKSFDCCLLPLLKGNTNGLKLFMTKNIVELMNTLTNSVTSLQPSSETIIYHLLGVTCTLCGTDVFKTLERTYQLSSSEKITKSIVKAFQTLGQRRLTSNKGDKKSQECFFRCHRAAYFALSLIMPVVDADDRSKLVRGLLLHEDIRKPKILWGNLVDCSEDISTNFPVVLEASKSQSEEADSNNDSINLDLRSAQIEKARLNLAQSSLATESVGTFDFTSAVTVSDSAFYARILGRRQQQLGAGVGLGVAQDKEPLKYDYPKIHRDCVEGLVNVVQYMVKQPITSADKPEVWITLILDGLKNNHINVKISILSSILNCSEELKPFSKHMLPSIVDVIVNDKIWNEPFNYFVKELIVMLLGWGETTENQGKLNELLIFIVEHTMSQERKFSRKDITSNNLQILATCLQTWKFDNFKESLDTILQPLVPLNAEEDAKLLLTISKCCLSNNVLPLKDPQRLLKILSTKLDNKYKAVYSLAAETLALLLKYLDRSVPNTEVGKKLLKVKSQNGPSFVTIVHILASIYPQVIMATAGLKDALLEMMTTLPQEKDKLIETLLKLLIAELERNTSVQNRRSLMTAFVNDLHGRNAFNSPCTSEAVETGIQILEMMLQYLSPGPSELFIQVCGWLSVAESLENPVLEARYYKCIAGVYSDPLMEPTKKRNLLKILVKASSNEVPVEVEEVLSEFWNSEIKNLQKPSEFMLHLLSLVGDTPNCLKVLLGRVLQKASSAVDYQKKMFEPLEDTVFYEYNVDTSWRSKQSSFLPLFAESISSQEWKTIPASLQSSLMRQRLGVNLLRATMSSSRLENSSNLSSTQTGRTSSTVLFANIGVTSRFDFTTSFSSANLDSSTTKTNPLHSLRTRFFPPKDTGSYVSQQIKKREQQHEEEQEKLKRKQDMRLTRNYRVGEFPDVEITRSDVVRTLVRIGQEDAEAGRLLFSTILSSCLNTSTDRISAQENMEELLQRNSRVSLEVASAIMDVCLNEGILLHTRHVSNLSTQHHMNELSILMLEKHLDLNKDTHDEPPPLKRSKTAAGVTNKQDVWIRMAQLYEDLEEYDVLKHIFEQADEVSSGTNGGRMQTLVSVMDLHALGKLDGAAETLSQFLTASEKRRAFEASSRSGSDNGYQDFIDAAYSKCLVKLSEWGKVRDLFKGTNVNMNKSKQLLSLEASIMLITEGQGDAEPEYTDDTSIANDKMMNPLLATLLACCNSNNAVMKAGSLLETFWPHCATEFTTNFVLSKPQRNVQMLQLQLASTLNDLLNLHKTPNYCDAMLAFLRKTKKLVGNHTSDLHIAKVVCGVRNCLVDNLLESKREEGLSGKTAEATFKQDLWLLSLAMQSQNYGVATKYLNVTQKSKQSLNEDLELMWRKLYIQYLSTFPSFMESGDWAPMWGSAWKKITKTIGRDESKLNDTIEMHADLLRSLITTGNKSNIQNVSNLAKSIGVSGSSIREVVQGGLAYLRRGLQGLDIFKTLDCNASIQLYQLMETIVRQYPEEYSDDVDILKLLLTAMLRSLAVDSKSGVLFFPRLVTLLEKHSNLHSTFHKLWTGIPLWKYLPWLDQIITSFNVHTALWKPIVDKLVVVYPDAFYLQYHYLLTDHPMKNLSEKFRQALGAVVPPTKLHHDAIEGILSAIKCEDYSGCRKCVDNFLNTLKAYGKDKDPDDVYGVLHRGFADDMSKRISAELTILDDQIANENMMDSDEMKQTFNRIKDAIRDVLNTHRKKIFPGDEGSKIHELSAFSPWLANYHHSDTDRTGCKIPGLFDKLAKPNVDFHPYIISFVAAVKVFGSLALPIQLSVNGNDAKRYSFLAKYGDDLRQDRRISQLFRVVNDLLYENPHTREKNIGVTAYSVTPLSPSFGIIEWLDNTMKLSSFILNSKALETQQIQTRLQYEQWMVGSSRLPSSSQLYKVYLNAANNLDRPLVERQYSHFVASCSQSLLTEHLRQRCITYEYFFKVRQNFIRSYASMCIVHWLLGIGDRHLQNSLLSLQSGEIVGIDFGRAFEVSNSSLAIPEMIPFRLTPNFTRLMEPYGHKGLFKEVMCTTWRCLIEWSDTIEFIATTFVNERSLDWSATKRNADLCHPSDMKNQEDWNPVHTIRDKLHCRNPIQILIDLLKCNPYKEVVPVYCKIVQDNRKSVAQKNSAFTPEEVVDCLLDLATDSNILGRMFAGMQSWI